MEIAPPLFAPLVDGIERYHANFHGRRKSSANFLRHGYESDFVVEVAKGDPRGRSQPKREPMYSQYNSSASQDNHWKAHVMEILFPY